LESLNESNLLSVRRYLEEQVERRRNQLEEAMLKHDTTRGFEIAGAIKELRHLIADTETYVRALRKGS